MDELPPDIAAVAQLLAQVRARVLRDEAQRRIEVEPIRTTQASTAWSRRTISFNLYYGWDTQAAPCDTLNPHDSWYHHRAVSLHELGHSLGLAHSDAPEAVMQALIPGCWTRDLTSDDRAGIIAIYGQ